MGQDESNLVLDAETGWGVALMQVEGEWKLGQSVRITRVVGARGPVAGINGIVGCDVSSMVARASRWETAWNGRTRQTATSTGHVWRNRAARGRVSQETALLMQPTADGPVGIVPGTLERSRRI